MFLPEANPRRPPSLSGLASGPVSDQSPLNLSRLIGCGDLRGCFLPLPLLQTTDLLK